MIQQSKGQESRAALERIYIAIRHLFIRGSYKPIGISGETLRRSLITLSPEIYGSIADPEKVELNGLLYVMERLPRGIEECRNIKLISREGLEKSHFEPIIPTKRVRNCYRTDDDQMIVEMTRGRSDIYDILTHLTFVYNEAEKVRRNSLDHKGRPKRDFQKLEQIVTGQDKSKKPDLEQAYVYLSSITGRGYDDVFQAGKKFYTQRTRVNSLFHIIYWMGKLAIDEYSEGKDREISFSPLLQQRIGHHFYGEKWARNIKQKLAKDHLLERHIHIISANQHSFLNTLYAPQIKGLFAKQKKLPKTMLDMARELSSQSSSVLQEKVLEYAGKNGLTQIEDTTGANLTVQIIDTAKIDLNKLPDEISVDRKYVSKHKPVLIVMEYAFGEQAFETMDELLKPYELRRKSYPLDVRSISVMGKAGILEGGKGDIMIPTSHIHEGTADNYPIQNVLTKEDFLRDGYDVYEGSMITVLGTSLQNREILQYFYDSSWKSIGLEMEGAHYQKAIQAASQIRHSINKSVKLRYAYYASDNPLETGGTLASGSLGKEGVGPTYVITIKILNQILQGL